MSELVQHIREQHKSIPWTPSQRFCGACGEVWPCDAIRAADEIEKLEETIVGLTDDRTNRNSATGELRAQLAAAQQEKRAAWERGWSSGCAGGKAPSLEEYNRYKDMCRDADLREILGEESES